MSGYTDNDFFHLAQRHSEAVADVKALRLRFVQEGHKDAHASLAKAVAREKDMRVALIEWKPSSNTEAQLKLLYLVQYLFATRSSLNEQEMAAIVNSIAHLREK
ncbi:hypothetical protein [Rhizobium leguminosarum]|uniref:hypothetical protein n=1 Tax=Rhizobium leguminosarum TaxID=384 RepID=UPI00143F13F0|nr:hypothetical protein [Rhizobium leguminosarum]NKL25039.1 hypothetical protein [Rhizobium leguminosarum bv. viciae]